MRLLMVLVVSVLAAQLSVGQQQPTGQTLNLEELVAEALKNNPEIRASVDRVDAAHAKARRASALDDPQLKYMREEMPGFRFNEAMYSRIELMQMIRFPSKLAAESEIAELDAEHSHHDHYEEELEVIAKLKSAYYELWLAQQSLALNQENARLLQQFVTVAKTKFGAGDAAMQDVLKATVELAKLDNQSTILRQQERSARAMLVAILNRPWSDTLGMAVIPADPRSILGLDTLQQITLQSRPMLWHDSLMVDQDQVMLTLAKREYLPDFTVGVQYVTVPVGDFRGWSVSAGMTIPFSPWTLGKASSRVDEAAAEVERSEAALNASRNMVLANVRDLYFKAQSARQQLDAYRTLIVPRAQQSLRASTTAYQNGSTDFLMLVDAYRTLVDLSMESLMVRMRYEQAVAELERQVGIQDITAQK